MDAIAIQDAGVTELATSVEGFDPLTYTLTWKNNNLTPSSQVIVFIGPCFMDIVEPGRPTFWAFKYNNTYYVWCYAEIGYAPSQGGSVTNIAKTYAMNQYPETTYDIYAAILPYTEISEADKLYVDYGSGSRFMGIRETSFENVGVPYGKNPGAVYGSRAFTEALTVSPYG